MFANIKRMSFVEGGAPIQKISIIGMHMEKNKPLYKVKIVYYDGVEKIFINTPESAILELYNDVMGSQASTRTNCYNVSIPVTEITEQKYYREPPPYSK